MTVFDLFEQSARQWTQCPFLHIPRQATQTYHGRAVDLDYGAALEQIAAIRDLYRRAGYGHGHRIGLILDNRAEFFLNFLALNALGVSVVPVNSAFRPEEMRYLVDHSDSCLLVTLPEYGPAAWAAAEDVPVVETTALHELPDAKSSPPIVGAPDEQTEAALMYTSGTTGKPKGCMLSNFYFLRLGEWYATLGDYCELVPGEERLITPLPLVHMNALATSTMGMVATGGCIIQLDRFHASNWWETVRESRATCLHYLGVMPAILLNRPESGEDYIGDQVKFGFGAGVDPKHHETFERRFGFPLIEGWAMTETGAGGCIMASREPRHVGTRCFGKPADYIEYRIVDEQGADSAVGEPGELLIRSKGEFPRRAFFSGYYKDPEATEEAWAGGWFHTGDIIRQGDDGSLYFVDRKKNIVRRSGENIAAVEVEGVLFQHPAVANCAVVPVPDDIRGEEVAAGIVLNDGYDAGRVLAEDIFAFSESRLVYFKTPGYLSFVDALPMTASQKIQRGEMKTLMKERLGRAHCHDLRHLKKSSKAAS